MRTLHGDGITEDSVTNLSKCQDRLDGMNIPAAE